MCVDFCAEKYTIEGPYLFTFEQWLDFSLLTNLCNVDAMCRSHFDGTCISLFKGYRHIYTYLDKTNISNY